jgi:outer membrane protein OmpA-like peptidoglycan-associated protein
LLKLSKRRANAVKKTLVSLGVDASRITTAGVGDNVNPVMDPTLKHVRDIDESGKQIETMAAKNRMVRIEVQ